jgi:hypothetical protein
MNNKRKAELSRSLSNASTFLQTLRITIFNGEQFHLLPVAPMKTLVKNLNEISDELLDDIDVPDEEKLPLSEVKDS